MSYTESTEHGILLIAHGSREAAANQEVVEMAERLSQSFREGPVVPCFLEIAAPSIEEGFEAAVRLGCKRITAVPYFLTSGAHVTIDIPAVLAECKRGHGEVDLEITAALGPDLELDQIALRRIYESERRTIS